MKKVIYVATLLVAAVCMAQDKAAKPVGPEHPKGMRGHPMPPEMMKELVAKFDKDGDGKLSDVEMKAARDARQAEMLKKFDKDGDGKLSPEEMKTANEARHAEMIKRFDKDGDGKLSDDEKKAARESFMKNHPKLQEAGAGNKAPAEKK
jgi:hypothetical protein